MRLSLLLCLAGAWVCAAQTTLPTYTVNTFAGAGPALGDGGPGSSAVLRFPGKMIFDSAGSLYIADQGDASVRKVTPDGLIATVAGTGKLGYSGDGGPANQAQLSAYLTGLAFDAAGNLYIVDSGNNRVRMVSAADGTISTVVNGSMLPGKPETSFGFTGIAIDGSGNLYLADTNYYQIFRIAPDGGFSVFAGTGKSGDNGDGGPAIAASFGFPYDILAAGSGALYVSDTLANRVRKITPDGVISAFAGNGAAAFAGDGGPAVQASLTYPSQLAFDSSGNLYIDDYGNARIRRIGADGVITTVAGSDNSNGFSAGDGGPATQAQFTTPQGVAISSTGDIYISDYDASVRVVSATDGVVRSLYGTPHFAGDGGPALNALFATPQALAGDGHGNFYLGDGNNFRIRKIDATGAISTIAGNGVFGNTGDGGPATAASIQQPLAIVADSSGNVYFSSGATVRRIAADGTISKVAGGGATLGDGGPATSASLASAIYGLALDASGSLYIADTANHRIRKVTPDGKISTFAGIGTGGDSGDGGPAVKAQMRQPRGLAFDSTGNLYVVDYAAAANRVRRISPDGTINAFAGSGMRGAGGDGDGGPALNARFLNPWGVAIDSADNVYVTDLSNYAVRVVTPDSIIHTIASGTPVDQPSAGSFSGDGGPAIGADYEVLSAVAFDGSGKVYVLDSYNERIRVLTPAPQP